MDNYTESYLKQHGCTPLYRAELLVKQGGLCAICGKSCKLNVDHCHETNKIRGLLCFNCNLLLGHAKDNISILSNAIEYLLHNEQ